MPAPALRPGVVARVAPNLLQPDPDNPRSGITERSVAALAANVKARGVLVPLLVRKLAGGKLVIKDGHRRWTAAKVAKVKDVPVLLAADDDTAQLRLDQVAVNQLHEHLQPMDTARMLRKLRDGEKLTPNDLAARMAKAGTPMGLKEIEASIALTDLPEWAQTMIDKRELDVAAAPAVLGGLRDKPVAKALPAQMRQAAGWDGTVDKRRAEDVVRQLTRQHGIDVTTRNSFYASAKEMEKIAHFDWRKVCKGCEHLRAFGDFAYCMSREGFDRHQAEAKEAGLGVGGEKPKASKAPAGDEPKKLTKRQQEKLEAEKAERREKVDGTRAENYLDQWLRGQVAQRLPDRGYVASSVVLWLACARPDAGLVGNSWLSGMVESRAQRAMETAAGRTPRFDAFLVAPATPAETVAVAIAGLPLMLAGQVKDLAQALGVNIERDWRADQPYLLLRTRDQLVAWLELYGLDTAGKVSELRQRLLDHPHTLEWTARLPHMEALLAAYLAPTRDEQRAARDISEEDEQLQRDEDAAYDDEAEDDEPPHGRGEDTNVEDCVSYADEEVDA